MTIWTAPQKCLDQLLFNSQIHRATAYVSANLTIKATRQGKPDRRGRQETFILTIGRPNYAEREFIRLYQKSGGKFPLRSVQLKFYPQTKKKAA